MTRINDKIEEIGKYLEELYDIFPDSFEDYRNNLEKIAACERYFEKIIESVIDLAFLMIKSRQLNPPEDDGGAFVILSEANIIDKALSKKLREAKGMRNFLVHQYDKTDDLLVFETIQGKLRKDIDLFLEKVRKAMARPD